MTKLTQFGAGEKAGGSQLIFGVQLLLEANPHFVVIALDIKNTFNEVKRITLLEKLWEDERLRTLWYYFCRVKVPTSYVDLGVGPHMTRAPFQCKEGEQQGVVESMPFFTLGINTANNQTNDKLRPFGGALVSEADDTYIIGPPHIAFTCLHRHKERVSLSGLSLQLTKN